MMRTLITSYVSISLLLFLLLVVHVPSSVTAMSASSTASTSSMAMKRILVTGGNKGIGRAICERLLSQYPDTYVLLGSRNLERGQQAVQAIINDIPSSQGRVQCVTIDTASDESVKTAAAIIADQFAPLYGIVNNAGVGWGHSVHDTINTNYFGPRRVNEHLGQYVQRPGGRIVHVSSASGPNFVSSLSNASLKEQLTKPWTIAGGVDELDRMARSDVLTTTNNAYGASKALLNAYTCLYAKANPECIVNAVTPGWIQTDLTKGTGATNPPEQGAVPPCKLLLDESFATLPTGRYYGSDCVRSPLHYYRGPGEAPYVDNDEDLQHK